MYAIRSYYDRNKYNSYCLADDIMEPYRPIVDKLVCELVDSGINTENLTTEIKRHFLVIPAIDVLIDGEKSPLMLASQRTAASLVKCYSGASRKLLYPQFIF